MSNSSYPSYEYKYADSTILDIQDFPSYVKVGIALSLISSLAALFVVCSYVMFPRLRGVSHTLVLWKAIGYIGTFLPFLIGLPEADSSACIAQGFFFQFFYFSEIMIIVSFIRHLSLIFQSGLQRLTLSITWRSCLIVWGLALVSSIIPLVTGSIGASEYSTDKEHRVVTACWIKQVPSLPPHTLNNYQCLSLDKY